jgi:hypothetical protein
MAYAYFDGADWGITTIDSSSDLRLASLALDSHDYPHISYWDVTAKSLKYAYNDGVDWHIQTVVPAGEVGYRSSIGILPGDRPCIAYLDASATQIDIAWLE